MLDPDYLETQKMWNEAVRNEPCILEDVWKDSREGPTRAEAYPWLL